NVPIPWLSEQHRIASILDKADAIRRKRREAVELIESYRGGLFDEMFRGYFSSESHRDWVPVSHFVERFEGGVNLASADRDGPDIRHYVLKVSAVTWDEYRAEEAKPLPLDYEPPREHFVRAGDLLFSRANTTELVGATVYVADTPPNRVLPD